jgi:hypothetical protein
MGKLGRNGVSRIVKLAFVGMLGMAPLAISGSAGAVPAGAPAQIDHSASTDGYVTKVYDDEHSRWRSHRRHGSDGEHGRWSSHRRWGSEYEHNRWRSHNRQGSDGGYHNRERSHHRHGSGY